MKHTSTYSFNWSILKLVMLLVAVLNVNQIFAQLIASPDTNICDGSTATLYATVVGSFGTSSYTFQQIPFAPEPMTGTGVPLGDDVVSQSFPIGFEFCFLGSSYTDFFIGSNGWISFSPGQSSSYTSGTIPSTDANVPKNAILGPWQDWHPGLCGGACIRYQTYGTAPNRRLVVSWDNVPMFSCTNSFGTFQIVCHETTGIVENHITNKPNCVGWAGGTATQGVHNDFGTVAFTAPGRNSTQWVTTNESTRFVPSGIEWFLGGTLVGVGDTIQVNPLVVSTYTAQVTLCSGQTFTDDVVVAIGNVNITTSKEDVSCFGFDDGEITVNPVGSNFPVSVDLVDASGQLIEVINNVNGVVTFDGLVAGDYTATVTDAVGCETSLDVTLTQPTQLEISGGHRDILCTGDNNGIAYAIASGGTTPYTLQWSDQLLQNTDTITNLGPGPYKITITDFLGCVVDTTMIVVQPLPLSLSFVVGADTCLRQDGAIRTQTQGGTKPYTYIWNSITDSIFYEVNNLENWNYISHLPTGDYTVVVVDSNACEIERTANVPMIVPPMAAFSSISKPEELTNPEVEFFNESLASETYEWHFGDGGISNALNPQHAYDAPGTFLVMLIAYNEPRYGCSDTTFRYMEVNPFFTFYIPNSFTPDGDGLNDEFKPVGENFEYESYNMQIYDRWGGLMWQTDNPNRGWDGIDPGSLEVVKNGTYIYIFTMKKFNTFEPKVITGSVSLYRNRD
jgi:gliding motility-associated-like protein